MALPEPYYKNELVTIYHGNCLELLPDLEPVDLVLTDPPYGVGIDTWDKLSRADVLKLTMYWLPWCVDLAPNALIFNTHNTDFGILCEMVYKTVRRIIWNKAAGAGASEARLWYAHEVIYHCHQRETWEVCKPKNRQVPDLLKAARIAAGLSRGGVDMLVRGKKTGLCYRWEEAACLPTTEQLKTLGQVLEFPPEFWAAWETGQNEKEDTLEQAAEKAAGKAADLMDVLTHRTVNTSRHPCEKPVPLLCDLLNSVGKDAENVLDLFAGSGSALHAAQLLGRQCVGVEIEEKYCEIAARRCEQAKTGLTPAEQEAGQLTLFDESGK